jgi:hypothetical protein
MGQRAFNVELLIANTAIEGQDQSGTKPVVKGQTSNQSTIVGSESLRARDCFIDIL